MSLHDFQMPPLLIEQLYRNSLVEIIADKKDPNVLPIAGFILPGKNKKHILLLVNERGTSFFNETDLNFLTGILAACKLTSDDVVLVNVGNAMLSYQELQGKFQPKIILGFGINLAELGFPLEFPLYQVQQYNNQSYLTALSLSELSADQKEKGRLWTCLRKIFSV